MFSGLLNHQAVAAVLPQGVAPVNAVQLPNTSPILAQIIQAQPMGPYVGVPSISKSTTPVLTTNQGTTQALSDLAKPKSIGIVAFPGWQPLDIMGPVDALWGLSLKVPINVYFLSADGGATSNFLPNTTAVGSKVAAVINMDYNLDQHPPLDVVLVPGGLGTRKLEEKLAPYIKFIKSWQPKVRYVHDQNIWTTSGVSAGTDGVLGWIESIWGADMANKIADGMEWNRAPADNDPFAKLIKIL
ncbi:hypothetical protein ABW20_dc0109252 [Dactylellina cionopaga]|nr:hypothetical protein ABW20_dc0109252 [Dactylellina cionopaga]